MICSNTNTKTYLNLLINLNIIINLIAINSINNNTFNEF